MSNKCLETIRIYFKKLVHFKVKVRKMIALQIKKELRKMQIIFMR